MAKKNESKKVVAEKTPVADTVITKLPDGCSIPTSTGMKYGAGNLLNHGRYAQGGVFDLHLMHSAITGKPFTLADIINTVKADNLRGERVNVQTPVPDASRINSHVQHLLGNNGNPLYKNVPHFDRITVGEKDGKWYGCIVDTSIIEEVKQYCAKHPLPKTETPK